MPCISEGFWSTCVIVVPFFHKYYLKLKAEDSLAPTLCKYFVGLSNFLWEVSKNTEIGINRIHLVTHGGVEKTRICITCLYCGMQKLIPTEGRVEVPGHPVACATVDI